MLFHLVELSCRCPSTASVSGQSRISGKPALEDANGEFYPVTVFRSSLVYKASSVTRFSIVCNDARTSIS